MYVELQWIQRCGASYRLPFLGIESNCWMKNAVIVVDSGIFFFIPVCLTVRSKYVFFDDCREITSLRVYGYISRLHSNQQFFFSVVHSEVLLIYLFRWWFFFSTSFSMSFIEKCIYTKLKIDRMAVVCMWKNKTRHFFSTWAQKKNTLQTHIHTYSNKHLLLPVKWHWHCCIRFLGIVKLRFFSMLFLYLTHTHCHGDGSN